MIGMKEKRRTNVPVVEGGVALGVIGQLAYMLGREIKEEDEQSEFTDTHFLYSLPPSLLCMHTPPFLSFLFSLSPPSRPPSLPSKRGVVDL